MPFDEPYISENKEGYTETGYFTGRKDYRMRNTGVVRKAREPEELPRLFIEQANQGNVKGLVALYEPGAVLALPDGHVAVGSEEIRRFYWFILLRASGYFTAKYYGKRII